MRRLCLTLKQINQNIPGFWQSTQKTNIGMKVTNKLKSDCSRGESRHLKTRNLIAVNASIKDLTIIKLKISNLINLVQHRIQLMTMNGVFDPEH